MTIGMMVNIIFGEEGEKVSNLVTQGMQATQDWMMAWVHEWERAMEEQNRRVGEAIWTFVRSETVHPQRLDVVAQFCEQTIRAETERVREVLFKTHHDTITLPLQQVIMLQERVNTLTQYQSHTNAALQQVWNRLTGVEKTVEETKKGGMLW